MSENKRSVSVTVWLFTVCISSVLGVLVGFYIGAMEYGEASFPVTPSGKYKVTLFSESGLMRGVYYLDIPHVQHYFVGGLPMTRVKEGQDTVAVLTGLLGYRIEVNEDA